MAQQGKRRRQTKSLEEKYEIINFYEKNPQTKQLDLAAKYDMKPQTLCDLIKNRQKIKELYEKTDGKKIGKRKRLRPTNFEDVDAALLLWFRQYSSRPDLRIDGEMLLKKANYFAHEFGYPSEISSSWINRWKVRWAVGKILKAGESGGVNLDVVDAWKDGDMKDILQRYKPPDIYNADETGLFWQMLPENSLGFIGEQYHGKKQPKQRITLLVGANMDGSEKLPMFAIGKSKHPRAFKHIKRTPVEYESNKKAWMRSDIFEQWMRKLDRRMGREGRKIAMILDNCTAHPHLELDNIELFFLPPNTTSWTQPMDAGIIKNFKLQYRRIMATRRLEVAEANLDFKWDLLDCLFAVKSAWAMVRQETVANCYKKVGFVATDVDIEEVTENSDNDQREFRNIWSRLEIILGDIPSMDDYINVDSNVDDARATLTDEEIIAITSEQNTDSPDSEEATNAEPEPLPTPTLSEAHKAIDCIRRFTLSLPSEQDAMLRMADQFEKLLLAETTSRSKQSTITDFFKAVNK